MAFSETVIRDILRHAEGIPTMAARVDELNRVLRGEEPLRVGLPISVDRASGKAPNGREYHVKIRGSTNNIARDGGYVPVEAWSNGGLKRFEKNPMIMGFHNYRTFPVGISVHNELDLNEGALVQHWLFNELTDVSRTMKAMYEGGWMRAASAGFIVRSGRYLTEKEAKDIQKRLKTTDPVFWMADDCELLETSGVPIPSDHGSLVLEHAISNARAHGVNVDSLIEARDASQGRSVIEMATRSADAPADQSSANAGEQPAAAPSVAEQIREALAPLTEALTSLRSLVEERLAPTPAAATQDDSNARAADTDNSNSGTTEASAPTEPAKRSAEDILKNLGVTKRDGESDMDALARHVEEAARERLGMPTNRS